ncbi:MAG: tetratricopeptide repeat protein [Planctomycetes bacterium]|nr:tetratricopeptide repeat protein [Planctomycetota bacterium]
MTNTLEKAGFLIHHARYDQAEKEIRGLLADHPENGIAHSMLALVLLHDQRRKKESITEAEKAVGMMPDSAYAFYILSVVHLNHENITNAERAIEEALKIDPEEPDYYYVYSSVRMQQKRHREALKLAEKGLELDPEDEDCRKARAIALIRLNRPAEADMVLEDVLQNNCEDPEAFAIRGWAALEKREYKTALEHFREALRLDPSSEYAKNGLVTALKAKSLFYRMFFLYYSFMNKLSETGRWGIIIGLYVLIRIMSSVSKSNPALAPYLKPIVIAYGVFAFLTWTMNSFYNFILRFNKYGKYALSKGQVMGANLAAGIVTLSATQLVIFLLTGQAVLILGAIGAFAMILPISGTFEYYDTKSFSKLATLTSVLFLMLAVYVVLGFLNYASAATWFMAYLAGVVIFTWVANIIISV